ncbi:DUF1493 domain-containing protein [Pectobacterium parmentieri]|uniref:DUF1493 domain-containing protein n=1 Tax=Pectobacterium parmentieri TaxID=1905730 RepID=A0A8B3F6X9_PECPM|nr:DUF1493 family protein [Pectobacterium parmentieri]AYH09695.1 DUF1493 domain-containing protein [Pectobacterium parmentieri]AYH19596.1 DUF1493 domain-containing protein [Pectobacterium parmentieri]AZS56076.1 DUF1493 domain-containing protein [Pectobacterium parmentieri]RKO75701.1 DUF1493 domain-containing protein [Pectobacterium parmentieri]
MVNQGQDVEKEVFKLVETYNGRSLFSRKRFELRHDTDLNEDFRMAPEDAYELMESYVDKFDINPKTIHFERYFPESFSDPHDPLTIQLLIDSANAGRWLGK